MKKLKWPFWILSITLFLPVNSLVAGGPTYVGKRGVNEMVVKNNSAYTISFSLLKGGATKLAPGNSFTFKSRYPELFGQEGAGFEISAAEGEKVLTEKPVKGEVKP